MVFLALCRIDEVSTASAIDNIEFRSVQPLGLKGVTQFHGARIPKMFTEFSSMNSGK